MEWTTIVLACLAVFVAVFGGYMKSIDQLHKAVFIGCGVIMIIFIIIQAIINNREKQVRDTKFDVMNNTLQNLQGQLTAFRDIGARLLTPSASIPQQSHEIPQSIKDLTNTELRTQIIQFANNMRDFETNFQKEERQRDFSQTLLKATDEERRKQWTERSNISMQRRLEYNNEFRKRFLGEATNYRDELIKRLNIMPPEERAFAFDGFLAGPNPINNMATYLEKLARQLPQ